MIRVFVTLDPALQLLSPKKERCIEIKLMGNSTVADVLDLFELRSGDVGLIVVNGKLVRDNCVLADGATVKLFTLFGGG